MVGSWMEVGSFPFGMVYLQEAFAVSFRDGTVELGFI